MDYSGQSFGQETDDNHLRPGSVIYYLFDLEQEIQFPCTSTFHIYKVGIMYLFIDPQGIIVNNANKLMDAKYFKLQV